MTTKVRVFGAVPGAGKQAILVLQRIKPFIDALFLDLKMLQLFKAII